MGFLLHDLASALRSFRKNLGYALTVTFVLALGVGGTATVFSFYYSVFLRPLPYPQPERIVAVGSVNQTEPQPGLNAPADFVDWKREAKNFEGLTSFANTALLLKTGDRYESFPTTLVTTDFFKTFGVLPRLGRPFAPEDFNEGKNEVPAILSDEVWRSRFGADPGVVGRTFDLSEGKCTIIGVMPPGFAYPSWSKLWVPLSMNNSQFNLRGNRYFEVVGRLAPGKTLADGENELKGIAASLAERHPKQNKGWSVKLVGLREWTNGDDRLPLTVLLSAVGLLLVIACANIAALALVRAHARRRELAVKIALGIGNGQLFRSLLVENLVLATFGGALGLLLARYGVDAIPLLLPEADARRLQGIVRLDWVVAILTMLVAQLTGIAFGIVPAFQAFRKNLADDLRDSTRTTESAGHGRMRQGLVVVQIALAVALLCGAGLLARSFANLLADSPGYDPNRLMIVNVSAPLPFNAPNEQKITFYRKAIEMAAQAPGVTGAALTNGSQFGYLNFPVNRPDRPFPNGDVNARYSSVSGNYFKVLNIPLVKGREFADSDREMSPLVFIINRAAAGKFFPGEEAVGKRLTISYLNRRMDGEIVGVVGDVRQDAPGRAPLPEVFASYSQMPWFSHYAVVRTTAEDPRTALNGLEASLQTLDPNRQPGAPVIVSENIAASVAMPRLYTLTLGIFAAAALGLAAVGIFGVTAYAAARRTREIGIRMALGATARDVRGMILKQGGILICFGAALGLGAAFFFSKSLKTLLFGVEAADPLTFVCAGLLLGLTALAACWIPARRATKVDPMTALRSE
jgi:putative ABC transport system permease protein